MDLARSDGYAPPARLEVFAREVPLYFSSVEARARSRYVLPFFKTVKSIRSFHITSNFIDGYLKIQKFFLRSRPGEGGGRQDLKKQSASRCGLMQAGFAAVG